MLPRTPPMFGRAASAPSVECKDATMPDAMEAGVKLKMPVGLLGHVTRAQRTLEELRQTGSPEGLIVAAIRKYEEEVIKLRNACEQVNPVDEVQIAAKAAWTERNLDPKERFLLAMKEVLMPERPQLCLNGQEVHDDQRSIASKGSKVSNISSASRLARAEAAAKTRALEEERKHRQQQRRLEEQERLLRLQREDDELEFQIQQAKIRQEELEEVQSISKVNSVLNEQRVVRDSLALNPSAPAWPEPWRAEEERPNRTVARPEAVLSNPSVEGLLQHILLPQSTLPTFEGDALEFMWFIKEFEMRVESVTNEPARRLHLLLQHLKGDARNLILGCQLADDAEEGYRRAKSKLVAKYGNKVRQALAFKNKLMAWPNIKKDSSTDLEKFNIQLQLCGDVKLNGGLAELDAAGTILQLMLKLPHKMQEAWQMRAYKIETNKHREANFQDFSTFVDELAMARNHPVYGHKAGGGEQHKAAKVLATSGAEVPTQTPGLTGGPPMTTVVASQSQSTTTTTASTGPDAFKSPCLLCSNNHATYRCQGAAKLSVVDRRAKLRGLCFACLKPGHTARQCTQRATCDKCKDPHPTIMHEERGDHKEDKGEGASGKSVTRPAEPPKPETTCTVALNKGVAVAVVPVKVWGRQRSQAVTVKAILDPGSTASFISHTLANQLQLDSQAPAVEVRLTTMANDNQHLETRVVHGVTAANLDSNEALVLPPMYVISSMPFTNDDVAEKTDVEGWQHLEQVPFTWKPEAQVELLIGMNAPAALKPLEVVGGKADEPYAVRTAMGWSLNGPLKRLKAREISNLIRATDIKEDLQKLYYTEFEDVHGFCQKGFSQEDKEWLCRAANSIKKAEDSSCGQYELALPFRNLAPPLHNNYDQALQRLEALRRRFARSATFQADYTAFMTKMENEGYIEEVDGEQETKPREREQINYVPHHGVYHPRKPGKIRVVFNCSNRFHGLSLNDCLLPGPDLTSSLLGVLLRFRQEPVAFMADIESMFYRVRVPPDQRDALRYLWWPAGDVSKSPRTYRMTVHLFGAASSPSCANFALRTAAREATEQGVQGVTQEVYETVCANFYVDDCLKSMATEEEAVEMAHGLRAACKFGGFRLTKFVTPSIKLLQSLPASEWGKSLTNVDLSTDKNDPMGSLQERALGVMWDVVEDTFRISVATNERHSQQTKRGMLSLLSSVYDPLGAAAPVVIVARILFRNLTREKEIGWDDEIAEVEKQRWQSWLDNLSQLDKVKIPRCLKDTNSNVCEWQLHVFCDASEEAYAAVAYLRSSNPPKVKFVMGKARVSPPRTVTIPRLELTAAKLATDVAGTVISELQITITQKFFWSDSQTVLKYLTNRVRRFHTFVANKVEAILNATRVEDWKYVPSEWNPADEGSRGLEPEAMARSTWIQGPEFLQYDESDWPTQPAQLGQLTESDKEVHTLSTAVAQEIRPSFVEQLSERYSKASKLHFAVAVWLCFIDYWRNKSARVDNRDLLVHPADRLKDAEAAMIRNLQLSSWPTELKSLAEGRGIGKGSPVYKLSPVLHPDGVLRMHSRTRVHLPILPSDSRVSALRVWEAHVQQGHLGRQATAAKVAQSYWIVGLNRLVRKIVKDCPTCQRQKAAPATTVMANLPEYRLQADYAFEYTGIDYFGPFFVVRGRARVKVYGVVFTCATMRAVHLEIAEDLSSASFINALRRFVARRGQVKRLISDNGTNFIGAHNALNEELKEQLRVQSSEEHKLRSWLRERNIEWSFNPPGASHHGGFWERLIRIVRQIFSVLLPQWRPLTYEGMNTLMCEIEAVLNNRPLTPVSEDPHDFEALTPNHLLLGRGGPLPPPGNFESDVYAVRFHWKRVQNSANQFWQRWTQEYKTLLHQRAKWHQEGARALQTEDVVLVLDPLQPREHWALGRVKHLHKNEDGHPRVATVQTARGLVKRPITKLCLLEAATNYWQTQ